MKGAGSAALQNGKPCPVRRPTAAALPVMGSSKQRPALANPEDPPPLVDNTVPPFDCNEAAVDAVWQRGALIVLDEPLHNTTPSEVRIRTWGGRSRTRLGAGPVERGQARQSELDFWRPSPLRAAKTVSSARPWDWARTRATVVE